MIIFGEVYVTAPHNAWEKCKEGKQSRQVTDDFDC